jgi:hypothetical protein
MGANGLASILYSNACFRLPRYRTHRYTSQPKTTGLHSQNIYTGTKAVREYVRLKKTHCRYYERHAGIIRKILPVKGLALLKEERQKIHTDNIEYYTLIVII